MIAFLIFLGWVAFLGALLYHRVSLFLSTILVGAVLACCTALGILGWFTLLVSWPLYIATALLFNLSSLRKRFITEKAFNFFKSQNLKMSETEQTALDAGTVWFEGELFEGNPNWQRLSKIAKPSLTKEEQDFIDTSVHKLCTMINEYEVNSELKDLPEEIWQYLKSEGYFGLVIPKKYGGLGFSALAHSEIINILGHKSTVLAVTVTVPNSLGPGELLLEYGTEEQKNHYLPRLADGRDIPCFGLTSADCGSDATSLTDTGIICEGEHNGEKVLGIRLNFAKRYITLAPIATVIGLAFKLYDPDKLYSDVTDWGITCALIPRDTAGVSVGNRHNPCNMFFQNGPIYGKDVFIPMSFIIGGEANAGKGWRMLVECLSIGRGISLPSITAGATKALAFYTGSYARIRTQFGTAIGNFEGIKEKLAKIAANAYISEAGRLLTAQAISNGERPSVPGAIIKSQVTERSRESVIHAMDVHGGKGIMMGPNNYLAYGYGGSGISVTVEGANILTRSMIIFGQGCMRCHPYALKEIQSTQISDYDKALSMFDQALTGHLGHILSNLARSFFFALGGSKLVWTPAKKKKVKSLYQKLTHLSSAFSFTVDICMLTYGGKLKFKETTSGNLADVLSDLYLSTAVLKRYHDDDYVDEDLPLVSYSVNSLTVDGFDKLYNIIHNLPSKPIRMLAKLLVYPLGSRTSVIRDRLTNQVSDLMLEDSGTKARLLKNMPCFAGKDNNIKLMHDAYQATIKAEPIMKRIEKALRQHNEVAIVSFEQKINFALQYDIISMSEKEILEQANNLKQQVIAVDDFSVEALTGIALAQYKQYNA